MLRPQIFNRFLRRALQVGRPDQKLVLGRNKDAKHFAVAGHIENILGQHRRLPDDANLRRLRRQNKAADVVILLDQPAVGGPGHRHQLHGGVDAVHGPRLLVIRRNQLLFGSRLRRPNLRRRHCALLADGASRQSALPARAEPTRAAVRPTARRSTIEFARIRPETFLFPREDKNVISLLWGVNA